MNKLLPYRIIGFILLPVAALLGVNAISGLLNALANPIMLLPLFFIVAIVIYVITSFVFLTKAIDKQQTCKHSIRDLIKVNAIMTLIVCFFGLMIGLVAISTPQMISQAIKQAVEQQPMILDNATIPELEKIFKIAVYVWFALSILFTIHIFYTFRLLKTYKHMFEEK